MPRAVLIAALLPAFATLHAQTTSQTTSRPIGTVSSADATLTNTPPTVLPIANGRTILTGNPTVTAGTHTAEIKLTRGGTIRVCQSTPLHLGQTAAQALLLTLDRGALEIHTKATPADSLLTPDLRFTPLTAGPLDLLIHVSANGDTCVDNHGRRAPALNIVDAFGQATYQLKPNQHVLFEHGSLREVVDRETVPCGCPPDDPRTVPLAEAVLRGGANAPPVTPAQAAAANPFPAAVSEGLAPPTPLPAETPGVTHVQVSTSLTYDPAHPAPTSPDPTNPDPTNPDPTPPTPIPAVAALPPPAPPPAPKPGPFTAIGHFFKRIFVR